MKQLITFVFKSLELMRKHSEEYDIESTYNGFKKTLLNFEERICTLSIEFDQAVEKDSIEKYTDIHWRVQGKN